MEAVAEELGRPIATEVQEEQNGTGHAVQCGIRSLQDFEGTIIVTNADVPLLTAETLTELREAHTQVPTAVTVLSVHQDDPTGYGRIIRTEDGEVTAIVEEKMQTRTRRRLLRLTLESLHSTPRFCAKPWPVGYR